MTKSFSQFRMREEQHENVDSSILSENLFTKLVSGFNSTPYYVLENPSSKEIKDSENLYDSNYASPLIALILHKSNVYVFNRALLHNQLINNQHWQKIDCVKLTGVVKKSTGLITELEFSGDYDENTRRFKMNDVIDNKNLQKIITKDALENLHQYENIDEEYITEAVAKKKIAVRNGRRKVLWKCPPGYKKKQAGGKQCVKRTGSEMYKLKRRTKKAARKRKGKKAIAIRKRKRSNIKRKNMGLGKRKVNRKPRR